MQIIYIYDVKGKDRKEFNRIKRMFYYRMNQMNLLNCFWRTRSVLVVTPQLESAFDDFFRSFLPNVEVYKIRTKSIEELKS